MSDHRPRRIDRRQVAQFGMALAVAWLAAAPAAAEKPLANPSSGVPAEWLTDTERSGFTTTPRYDETVAYCQRLAAASPWVNYQVYGLSPRLRPLPLVVVSKEQVFYPSQLSGSNKLVVMIQNCIHAGECEGKDASMMLIRDIAVTKKLEHLLDHVNLVVVPIFNVDGHERFGPYNRINQNGPKEMGWRVTSKNLNLNRDYLKADAPEMRALLELWNGWRPHLHFDTHTTDGGDWQYDVTFAYGANQAADPAIADWLMHAWHPHVVPTMEADGHITMPYFNLVDSKNPAQGIASGGFAPRFSTGYFAIRNRPSILVETHMLKPYRTRVLAQYSILRNTLAWLNRDPQSLKDAVDRADRASEALGRTYDPARRVTLTIERTDDAVPFVFKGVSFTTEESEVSGVPRIIYDASKPIDIATVWHNKTQPGVQICPPLGYLVPAEWTEVIDRVRYHGLQAARLDEPVTMAVESYRFKNVTYAKAPYEGRFRVSFDVEPIRESRHYAAGSLYVPLEQRDARVVMHLFEPQAPDSLVSWGFFHPIFERKEYAEHYTLEKLARKMLANDPSLKQEFEQKLAADKEFAADPRARLLFFYRRSPYWDQTQYVYPVGRAIKPLSVELYPI
ncbi:MAG: M14 family metallopeptidase [Phycisphaerae bacterium]